MSSWNAMETHSNAVDVSPSYLGDSYLVDGIEILAAISLNPEDGLLPYPSPPAEPELKSIPTMLKPHISSTSAVFQFETPDNGRTVSMSTSFNPTSHSTKPDLIFSTSDFVLFYVHSQVLRRFPSEAFSRVLWGQNEDASSMAGSEIIHPIPESSAVFNVILHALYGTSPARNSPSFEVLVLAVDRMQFYGMNPKDFVTTLTPLYHLLLPYAPTFPLQLYSLAGCYGLEDLAVATSSHLLSFPILNLPDEMAERMGPIYLKRLFCLHINRMNALKQALLSSPYPHPAQRNVPLPNRRRSRELGRWLQRIWHGMFVRVRSEKKSGQSFHDKLGFHFCDTSLFRNGFYF